MPVSQTITIQDILDSRKKVMSVAYRTPLVNFGIMCRQLGKSVHLKLENLQYTGSFKLRGAINEIMNLPPSQKKMGVIAVSSGNHGKAVSFVSSKMGINSIICVSSKVPKNKIEGMKELGGRIIIAGATFDEASDYAHNIQSETGLRFLEPFDDPFLIAGQGTIGIEIVEDLPDVDIVIVPVAGGGLISGIAIALKSLKPNVKVIGVSMDTGPVMYHSLRAGRIVEMEEKDSLADALIGGIGKNNFFTFDICRKMIDDMVLVTEEEIGRAMVFLLEKFHMLVEGGAAVGVAALLANKIKINNKNVAVVITGGNVEIENTFKLYQKYMG